MLAEPQRVPKKKKKGWKNRLTLSVVVTLYKSNGVPWRLLQIIDLCSPHLIQSQRSRPWWCTSLRRRCHSLSPFSSRNYQGTDSRSSWNIQQGPLCTYRNGRGDTKDQWWLSRGDGCGIERVPDAVTPDSMFSYVWKLYTIRDAKEFLESTSS